MTVFGRYSSLSLYWEILIYRPWVLHQLSVSIWLPKVDGRFDFENNFKENLMTLFELCSQHLMSIDQRASEYSHRLSVCWLLQVVTDIKFATYVTNGNHLIYFWAGVKCSRINANNLISVFYDFSNREVIKNGYFTVRPRGVYSSFY